MRNRAEVDSQSLRKPDMLPPVEIRQAVAHVVATHLGTPVDQVVTAVARALGFATTTAALRSVLENEIAAAVQSGELIDRDGKLSMPESAAE